MTDRRMTYSFGPLERRGLLGPVRAGQAALLVLAAVATVACLDALPSATGALVAGLLLGLAAAAAFAPLGGRTPEEWLPIGAAFALRRIQLGGRWRSSLPGAGTRARSVQLDRVDPPPALTGVSRPILFHCIG